MPSTAAFVLIIGMLLGYYLVMVQYDTGTGTVGSFLSAIILITVHHTVVVPVRSTGYRYVPTVNNTTRNLLGSAEDVRSFQSSVRMSETVLERLPLNEKGGPTRLKISKSHACTACHHV